MALRKLAQRALLLVVAAVVVLGAQSNQGRFWETRHLFNWMSTHTQKLLGLNGADPAQAQQQH